MEAMPQKSPATTQNPVTQYINNIQTDPPDPEEFESLGADIVFVSPGQEDAAILGHVEDATQENESALLSFFKNIPFMMGVIEILGNDIVHISDNPKACEFFGRTSEEMQGRRASELGIPPEIRQRWIHFYQLSERLQAPVRFEYPDDANGQVSWFSASVCPVANSPHHRFCYIVTDITERKRIEREIRRLNSSLEERARELEDINKELESFSYSVSHDLRAPLRAIAGFSRILVNQYGAELPPDARRYLDIITGNTEQMGQLIDGLLDFSRLGRKAITKQCFQPDAIIDEVLAYLAPEMEGRSIEIIRGTLPDIEADPGLFKEVILNLLSNAVKYSRKREHAVIEIGTCLAEPVPTLFVRDNGIGFDMRYAEKIFGVFQRLHRAEDYEGTGVGLAIVQRIILRHGGTIRVDAAVDRGAIFTFTFAGEVEDDDSDCW